MLRRQPAGHVRSRSVTRNASLPQPARQRGNHRRCHIRAQAARTHRRPQRNWRMSRLRQPVHNRCSSCGLADGAIRSRLLLGFKVVKSMDHLLSRIVSGAALAVVFYIPSPAGGSASDAQTPGVALARPGLAPVGATGKYLDEQGRVLSITGFDIDAGTNVALFGCTPGNGADNPHYTSPDVSGHGTYVKGSCTNNTAKVYNCLYEWYTDATWRR